MPESVVVEVNITNVLELSKLCLTFSVRSGVLACPLSTVSNVLLISSSELLNKSYSFSRSLSTCAVAGVHSTDGLECSTILQSIAVRHCAVVALRDIYGLAEETSQRTIVLGSGHTVVVTAQSPRTIDKLLSQEQ